MANSGFLYFLGEYSSEGEGDFGFYYDFSGSGTNSGTVVNRFADNDYTFTPSISGNGTSFWSKSGSGQFDGSSFVKLNKVGTAPSDTESTLYCIAEKSGISPGLIFSNLSSGSPVGNVTCSGFSFGLNAANRLFFEYYDNMKKKPVVITSNKIIADKNCAFLRTSSTSVSFGYYDFFNQRAESESYDLIYGPEPSDGFYIGAAAPTAPAWAVKNKFVGWIDDITFACKGLSEDSFSAFASGSVYAHNTIPISSYYITGTGITGTTTGWVLTYSGVTGYSLSGTGVVTDIFGNTYTGFSAKSDLSGAVYTSGIIPLTGHVTQEVVVDSSGVIVMNTGMANSYGYKRVNLLAEVSNPESYCFFYPASGHILNRGADSRGIPVCNYDSWFDRVAGKFSHAKSSQCSGFSPFLNGKFQTSGFLTGNKFDGYDVSGGDYVYSGGKFYSSGAYVIEDDHMVDEWDNGVRTVVQYARSHNEIGRGGIAADFYNQIRMVFFNGQKLVSGLNYQVEDLGFMRFWYLPEGVALFDGVTGDIQILYSDRFDMIEAISTGAAGSPIFELYSGTFPQQSMYFLNGIRQHHGDDYVLTAKNDLLSGFSSKTGHLGVLFNNSFDFFE